MRLEKAKAQIPWTVYGSQKPASVEGCEWKPIKMNPLKPQQIQGWRRVEIRVSVEPLQLHKPQDIGIPKWLERDIED